MNHSHLILLTSTDHRDSKKVMVFPNHFRMEYLIFDHCELTQLLSSNADFQFRIKTDRLLLASLPTRYPFSNTNGFTLLVFNLKWFRVWSFRFYLRSNVENWLDWSSKLKSFSIKVNWFIQHQIILETKGLRNFKISTSYIFWSEFETPKSKSTL